MKTITQETRNVTLNDTMIEAIKNYKDLGQTRDSKVADYLRQDLENYNEFLKSTQYNNI